MFVDFYVFTSFWLNLSDWNLKLFWTSKQNNFRFRSSKFNQKWVKTQISTNNHMSSFGLIEKNVELSHIFLAVKRWIIHSSSAEPNWATAPFGLAQWFESLYKAKQLTYRHWVNLGLKFLRPLFSHLQSDWFTIIWELCCDCLTAVKFLVEGICNFSNWILKNIPIFQWIHSMFTVLNTYTYLALHIICFVNFILVTPFFCILVIFFVTLVAWFSLRCVPGFFPSCPSCLAKCLLLKKVNKQKMTKIQKN